MAHTSFEQDPAQRPSLSFAFTRRLGGLCRSCSPSLVKPIDTGWDWASAPLFGAAGSGFLDQGYLLDFEPIGSVWITGGAIGPEGSIFAFLGVLCAFGLLIAATPRARSAQPMP